MSKKFYPIVNETLSIVTQVNQTYNGKEIPQAITTTAGVFVQSGKSIKTSNSKTQPKSNKS